MDSSPAVPTVDARSRPPPLPRGVCFARCMGGDNPTLTDTVVKNVLGACRNVDNSCKLMTMTNDSSGNSIVRVRAGDVHSVASLQRALCDALPLSETTVSESWLDGALEAEVKIFTVGKERELARSKITKSRLMSYSLLIAWACLLIGLGEWAAAVRAARARLLQTKDEL